MSTGQNDVPPAAAPPRRRLQRSRSDRVVAGVCGGLGDYFDVDPVIFRIAFVVLAFVGGAGFLLYPAAWLLLPDEGDRRSIGEAWVQRGKRGHWIAIALIVIGALILSGDLLSRHHDGGIGFAVIAIVVGVVLLRRHPVPPLPPSSPEFPWSPPPPPAGPETPDFRAPTVDSPSSTHESREDTLSLPPPPPLAPPPGGGGGADWGPPADEVVPPRGRSLSGIVLSVLLIGAGAVGILHAAGVLNVSVSVFLAGALIFTGVALVISGWTGGTSGLIAIGVVLTIVLAIATVVRAPLSGGVGDRHWVPASPEEVRTYYKHGGGDVVIDLSHVTFPTEGQEVRARLGVGHLKIVVPTQARATIAAHAGVGDVTLFGRHEGGIDVESAGTTGSEGGTVHLRLEVGAGQIEVVRALSAVNPPLPPVLPNPPAPVEPPTTVALR